MDFKLFPTVDKIAHKSVLHADANMSVHDVSRLMERNNVSSVVLEHPDKRCILSIEDLLNHFNNGGLGSAALHELPEHRLSTIQGHQHILTALEVINSNGDRYLAVENSDGSLLGILTYTDILSAADPTLLIEKKTIGELISRSVPISFSIDWFLEDVLCHFKTLEDSVVIVEDNIPIGIITTKDVFRIVASQTPVNRPLSTFMTSPVVTAQSSWTVSEAFVQLKSNRIKRLVVVNDQNKLAGIITQSELVGFAFGSWITLTKHHSGELRELVSILDSKPTGFDPAEIHDPATGLDNRQMLLLKVTQEIERINRYHSPTFCLLLLTIAVPDTKIDDPHQQTSIIKSLADELLLVIRSIDSICLWNDKTLALLLPQTSVEQSAYLIERIQKKLLGFQPLKQQGYEISLDSHCYRIEESCSDFLDAVTQKIGANTDSVDSNHQPAAHD